MTHIARPSNMKRLAAELGAKPKAAPTPPTDEVGRLANDAWAFADAVFWALVTVRSPLAKAEDRLEALERFFTAWPSLCDRVAKLEVAAPNCSAKGYERAAMAKHVSERRRDELPDFTKGRAA